MSAIVVRQSPIHGTGVFAARNIEPGEEIIEYKGRMLTHAEADAEYAEDDGHTFLFTLNDHFVIDATVDGNEARWINHSCDPNCESVLIEDEDGDPTQDQMMITAIRPIQAGEELTYDYCITTDEPMTDAVRALWACRCGAPACRGVMLKPEEEEAAEASAA